MADAATDFTIGLSMGQLRTGNKRRVRAIKSAQAKAVPVPDAGTPEAAKVAS